MILFEDHAVLNWLLLVKIVPSAICTLLTIAAIFQDPVAILILNCGLHFGDKLIVNADVTIRRATNYQLLLIVFANATSIYVRNLGTYTTSGFSRLYGGKIFSFSL